jgi:hypothetical protein
VAKIYGRGLLSVLRMLVWSAGQGHAQAGLSDHTLPSAREQWSYVL